MHRSSQKRSETQKSSLRDLYAILTKQRGFGASKDDKSQDKSLGKYGTNKLMEDKCYFIYTLGRSVDANPFPCRLSVSKDE